MSWTVTTAKSQFKDMLDKAVSEGPQFVHRRGREFVVMTLEQHENLIASQEREQLAADALEHGR